MSRAIKKISTGYQARPLMRQLHMIRKRFKVYVLHRRFGKTVGAINELIDHLLRCDLNRPQYGYIAPTYTQAKRVAWEYFKEYTKCFPGRHIHEGELRIDIPKPTTQNKDSFARIYVLGADNPDSIRGMYFDGVIMDEYAEMNPIIWTQVVRPALSDRGGWGIFIGTPKGSNHFKEIYELSLDPASAKEWFGVLYRASETGIISRDELEEARRIMLPEEFEQEYECSFSAALIGSYFGRQIEEAEREGRITRVPYDCAVPVDTWWDLGIDDQMAIWFTQTVGQEIHMIDYLEDNNLGIPDYARKLLQDKPYVYREHNFPHDGAARELGTGRSREEVARENGLSPLRVRDRWDVSDSINASRVLLPRCWFDAEKCRLGIEALKNYERKWDAKKKIFDSRPLHNWASHAASAFAVLAQGHRDNSRRRSVKNLPRVADEAYNIFN